MQKLSQSTVRFGVPAKRPPQKVDSSAAQTHQLVDSRKLLRLEDLVVRNSIQTGPKLKPTQKQMLSATMAAGVAAAATATVAMVDMVAGVAAADAGLRPIRMKKCLPRLELNQSATMEASEAGAGVAVATVVGAATAAGVDAAAAADAGLSLMKKT